MFTVPRYRDDSDTDELILSQGEYEQPNLGEDRLKIYLIQRNGLGRPEYTLSRIKIAQLRLFSILLVNQI